MTFRKDVLTYYEFLVFVIFMIVLGLASIVVVCPLTAESMPLISVLSVSLCFFIMFLVKAPRLYNEFVSITEIGISCSKEGKELWAFKWDDISELRKCQRFRSPSISIITYDKHGKPNEFGDLTHYFQLGKEAKNALKKYYRPSRRS